MSLPLAFFVGPQVLLKENYPGSVLKTQRCMQQITENQVCISLYLQTDQQCKSFTQVVSLNSCDFFLAVLVYCVMVKTNSDYAAKVAERSNRSLPIYLPSHFAQTFVLFKLSLIEHIYTL